MVIVVFVFIDCVGYYVLGEECIKWFFGFFW